MKLGIQTVASGLLFSALFTASVVQADEIGLRCDGSLEGNDFWFLAKIDASKKSVDLEDAGDGATSVSDEDFSDDVISFLVSGSTTISWEINRTTLRAQLTKMTVEGSYPNYQYVSTGIKGKGHCEKQKLEKVF